jgi:hypothetical protein
MLLLLQFNTYLRPLRRLPLSVWEHLFQFGSKSGEQHRPRGAGAGSGACLPQAQFPSRDVLTTSSLQLDDYSSRLASGDPEDSKQVLEELVSSPAVAQQAISFAVRDVSNFLLRSFQ